jgi:hypothetical protein
MNTDDLKFSSKVDAWIPAVVLLSVLTTPVIMYLAPAKKPVTPMTWMILAGAGAFTLALVGWMFATTAYFISGPDLRLKSGPVRMAIPIDKITRIGRGSWVGSAIALSLSRIEIQYGRFQSIMISPEDPRAFIQAIIARAPHVAIEDLDEYR